MACRQLLPVHWKPRTTLRRAAMWWSSKCRTYILTGCTRTRSRPVTRRYIRVFRWMISTSEGHWELNLFQRVLAISIHLLLWALRTILSVGTFFVLTSCLCLCTVISFEPRIFTVNYDVGESAYFDGRLIWGVSLVGRATNFIILWCTQRCEVIERDNFVITSFDGLHLP